MKGQYNTYTYIDNKENVVDPEPTPGYIPRKLPNEAINEIVNRFQIPKTVTPTSSKEKKTETYH